MDTFSSEWWRTFIISVCTSSNHRVQITTKSILWCLCIVSRYRTGLDINKMQYFHSKTNPSCILHSFLFKMDEVQLRRQKRLFKLDNRLNDIIFMVFQFLLFVSIRGFLKFVSGNCRTLVNVWNWLKWSSVKMQNYPTK